jgi:hypothetical protein
MPNMSDLHFNSTLGIECSFSDLLETENHDEIHTESRVVENFSAPFKDFQAISKSRELSWKSQS